MLSRKSGAKLAIKYGYIPCMLGLCGPQDEKKRNIITQYLKQPKKLEKAVREVLADFKGAYPYYQLIARSNCIRDPLAANVVAAYWTGNSLLKNVKISDFLQMMRDEFLPLGKMQITKIKKLPDGAIPFHNMHVLAIGSVTGRFKETKPGLDLCRVSWGRVKRLKKDYLLVERQPLRFGKKISLSDSVTKQIRWNKHILPAVKVGDWISMHWGTAVEKLDKNRLDQLRKYNQLVLDVINCKNGTSPKISRKKT